MSMRISLWLSAAVIMITLVAGASLSYAIPANSVEFDLGAAAIGNQLTGCHFASGDSGVVCPNSQNFTINDPEHPWRQQHVHRDGL